MTTPSIRSAGTMVHTATNSTGVTPGAPAGAATGDYLFMILGLSIDDLPGPGTDVFTLTANSSGWTRLGTYFLDVGTNAVSGEVWIYEVTGAVPTMPTVQHADLQDQLMAQIFAVQDCNPGGSCYEGFAAIGDASKTALVGTAVTTSGNNRLVIHLTLQNDDRTRSAVPTGYTEFAQTSLTTPDGLIWIDYQTVSGASTISAPTSTIGLAEDYVAMGFALYGVTAASTNHFLSCMGAGK